MIEVVKAFQAALQTVSGEEDEDQNDYRVDGSSGKIQDVKQTSFVE